MPRTKIFERYLSILGIEPEEPSHDHLRRLVRAQLVRVPFENISKLYLKKTRDASFIPSLEEYLDGIERFNFGGTCYANNPYFAKLLHHCGYDVDLCSADMTKPDVHVVSMVHLEGREYLVDVGYGAPFYAPIPLDLIREQEIPWGENRYVLHPRDEQGRSRMDQYRDGELVHSYLAKPEPREIGDFAEMFTALYLSGLATPKDLGSMYNGSMPAAAGTWVNQSAALAVEPLTSGFWQVAIAVDALELIDGAYESAGIQYFELTVAEKTPYPVAVSAPARIPPPANVGEDGASDFTGTVPSDQAAAVSHFVNGYLTGQEDIARYVTPTARIQLFAEPPYASATITSLGSDELGNVTVAVSAVTNGGAMHPLQYTVALSFEAGVWEVADLTSVVGLE